MGELEIPGEVEGARGGDIPIGLEIQHRSGVTGKQETTDQLGNNVKGDLYVGDGHNEPARNTEDDGEEDTVQHDGGGGVGGVSGDASGANADGGAEDDEVDPLGNPFVRPHQTGVDVLGVGGGWFLSDQALEAESDLATVVQSGVSNNGSVDSKECAIGEGVTGRQTGDTASTKPDRNWRGDVLDGGISLVGSLIK